jgi:hypothetical protein
MGQESMTTSKEFQEQRPASQIAEAIALIVGKLVELDVTTDLTANDTTPKISLKTHISLVTGKITTEVNPELLIGKSSQQLLDFHTAQITATNAVVRDHLHSLRELLQILSGAEPIALSPTVVQPPLTIPVVESVAIPANAVAESVVALVDYVAVTPPPAVNSNISTQSAAGMVAAVAQAGPPQLDEADSIPNKFDQVLKSAGVREDDGNSPFQAAQLEKTEFDKQLVDNAIAQPLHETDAEWDEWLLEEDAILSELSQASAAVAKDKIPDWQGEWFTQPHLQKNAAEEWEQFIPEYIDLDAPAHRGQANVERFRQNLVNDPQLMSELLAELDDIEKLNKDEFPKP